jgi:hypothetical protein
MNAKEFYNLQLSTDAKKYNKKDLIRFAESYHAARVAAVTDEMIEERAKRINSPYLIGYYIGFIVSVNWVKRQLK